MKKTKSVLKRIEEVLVKWMLRRYKYLRVAMEIDLPPEFIVSDHAKRRIEERYKCNETKIRKITVKAWNSKLPIEWNVKDNRIARSFNGHIFIFAERYLNKYGITQKTLVTVINPRINHVYDWESPLK
jgi:hypothetical protein